MLQRSEVNFASFRKRNLVNKVWVSLASLTQNVIW